MKRDPKGEMASIFPVFFAVLRGKRTEKILQQTPSAARYVIQLIEIRMITIFVSL